VSRNVLFQRQCREESPANGDYLTIRQHEPCDMLWTATSYALLNGTSVANLDAHYVEFGIGHGNNCYRGWRDLVRTIP